MKVKQYVFIPHPEEFIKGNMNCFVILPDKGLEGYKDGYILVGEVELEVNLNEDSIRQSLLASLDMASQWVLFISSHPHPSSVLRPCLQWQRC